MPSALIRAEIGAAQIQFRIHKAALTTLLESPEGPVARDLIRRAIRVEGQAKQNATGRPGPMVRTGRLRGSITWRLGHDSRGLYADIGTAVVYAPFVEPKYPFLKPALEAARL